MFFRQFLDFIHCPMTVPTLGFLTYSGVPVKAGDDVSKKKMLGFVVFKQQIQAFFKKNWIRRSFNAMKLAFSWYNVYTYQLGKNVNTRATTAPADLVL